MLCRWNGYIDNEGKRRLSRIVMNEWMNQWMFEDECPMNGCEYEWFLKYAHIALGPSNECLCSWTKPNDCSSNTEIQMRISISR